MGSKFIATCLSQARRRVLLPALISTRCFLHVLCDTREGEWVELAWSPIVSQSSECWENLSVGSCVIAPYMCPGKVCCSRIPPPLSLFLSLSLCFPFILLPRSRSREKQGAGLESASYQKNLEKRNCFLSTTAAALVFSFFFFSHTTVVPHYPVPGSICFFFFWGFEVSLLQWLLQKKRC